MSEYTEWIEDRAQQAYDVAEEARSQKKDPEPTVDVPRAEDLAAKSVGLVTADQFSDLKQELSDGKTAEEKIIKRIRELEDEYVKNDERVALVIGREIAQEEFYEFDDRQRAIDAGLRIGLSYMTGGIVTAPLEGIADVMIRDNDDGSEYLAVSYAGPIRSAGGTASAMSVLLADYIRIGVDIDRYKPRDQEVERYATEVEDYFTRVTKKQYTPERKETKLIAESVPIEVTGTPTEKIEVSNYKDLPRIETNQIRGGMCLVYLDGLPLKASKIKKRIKQYGEEFGLEHWSWVEDYLDLQHEIHSSGDDDDDDDDEEGKSYEPNDKFMDNIVGGRPVFAHPGRTGGFRLRYGRSRTGGLAAVSFHPATTELTDRFMAAGTQLKTEYPGKATAVTPCDTIEPPIVKRKNGDVVKVETREQAQDLKNDIEKILFMGDILVPYGEFLENGKDLLPSPYVVEWWALDVKDALEAQDVNMDLDSYIEKPFETPTARTALTISRKLDVPLHPQHTYYWEYIDHDAFMNLHQALRERNEQDGRVDKSAKDALEQLFIPHAVEDDEIVFDTDVHIILDELLQPDEIDPDQFKEDIREVVHEVSGIKIRDRAPNFLGNRMGRPEKAERRWLKGKPQVLFPCGRKEGGRMRNLMETYRKGSVKAEIFNQFCENCKKSVHYSYCPFCGEETVEMRKCRECEQKTQDRQHCGEDTVRAWYTDVNVKELLDEAMENLGIHTPPELLKSPRGVTGRHKHVEPLEKGLIRQKYDLYVNKDGTIRYDAVDLPITHFKPKEIGVSVEKLHEMGYTHDIDGNELEHDDQVLELKYQDIIIPDNLPGDGVPAAEYMLRVARFIDELLEDFYGLEPYYDAESKEDLVGALVIGLAPHTSAGTVGRIIGFTSAKGIYAHPYWHAGKRRNCDGDEDSILLMMDALLNFSRQFLPDQRGTRTMDAPLILSTVLHPTEVDDEAWNVDVVDHYPREFYEATHEMKGSWEVDIKIAEDMVHEESGFKFTHDTTDIRDVPVESNYVTQGDMSEKVMAQLELGERVQAVDEAHVAELIIDKHFISDIKGNLRAFSEQEFQCRKCNETYRRVPLQGRCTNHTGGNADGNSRIGGPTDDADICGEELALTIYEGMIKKYLNPSEEIAESFAISPYTRQQIMILKENVQSLFGKDDRQSSLGNFV